MSDSQTILCFIAFIVAVVCACMMVGYVKGVELEIVRARQHTILELIKECPPVPIKTQTGKAHP